MMPQRSPLIIGLLFAATLAVNVVAAFWVVRDLADLESIASITLFLALAVSQINLLCVWATFARQPNWYRGIAPFASAVAAAGVLLVAFWVWPLYGGHSHIFWNVLCVFELQATVALAATWVFRQILSKRLYGEGATNPSWQFSLLQSLAVMTVVAVLLSILKEADDVINDWLLVLMLVANSIVLLIVVIIAYRATSVIWPFRFAAAVGVAVVVGIVMESFPDYGLYWAPSSVIQVVVLWVWIYFAQLVPRPANVDTREEAKTTPPE